MDDEYKLWNIIPIKHNSKIPAIKWLEYQDMKFPTEDLQYYEGLNKAVICGKTSNNLVILDFDFEDRPYFQNILQSLKHFKTLWVATPHGLHVYFYIKEGEVPDRRTQIKAKLPELKAFDILGNGGYALIPPSIVDDNFYMEANNNKPMAISREAFNNIVSIFEQKDETDEAIYKLTAKLDSLREPFQKILKGEIEIESISARMNHKEFKYWKALFLESRANSIPDTIIMGMLAKSQPSFNYDTTKIQLRQIKDWEKPYTNYTLNKMFNEEKDARPPPDKEEDAWVSIARDLVDTHEIITMSDTRTMMHREGNIFTDDVNIIYDELGRQLITAYKGKSYNNKRTAALKFIEDTTKFDRHNFCYDRWIINFKNGYFDVKLNKFVPAELNKDKIFCYEIPHDYIKGIADCPLFKKLLVDWLGYNNIVNSQDIFEMLGYSMTMNTHLKMAFMVYGNRNSGKTAFQNILSYLIGIRNMSGTSLHRLGSNEFGTDNLQFKILNMVGDMGDIPIDDLSVFKNLTGGDTWVHGEMKGGFKFEFRNMVKIWYNVNFIPIIKKKDDEAFFSRWMLIHFPNHFPLQAEETIKEIWDLINDNPEEIQGIIHECIKGCKRLIERNEYFRPELIENTTHIWEYESDPLYAFIYDNCELNEKRSVNCNEFRNMFNKALYIKKKPQVSAYKLNNMLETRGIFQERSTTDDREYFYEGIGWADNKKGFKF